MATSRFADHLLTGVHASRPAANAVPAGTLYACSTHGLVYQSDGSSTWSTWATLGAPALTTIIGTDTFWATKGDIAIATANDTAAVLPVGSNNQVLTADSTQTTGVKWAAAGGGGGGAWTLLYTLTIAGSAGDFDQASISGSYNDLILVGMLRGQAAAALDNPYVRFNNDSGSNYQWQQAYWNGSTNQANEFTAMAQVNSGVVPGGSAASGWFGYWEATVPGYASTTWRKMIYGLSGSNQNTTAANRAAQVSSGSWNNTAAITRVQVASGNGSGWAIGSTLRIYGRT